MAWVSPRHTKKPLCCALKHLKNDSLVAKYSNFCISFSSINFFSSHPEQELYWSPRNQLLLENLSEQQDSPSLRSQEQVRNAARFGSPSVCPGLQCLPGHPSLHQTPDSSNLREGRHSPVLQSLQESTESRNALGWEEP